MEDQHYQAEFLLEQQYLQKTLDFVSACLGRESGSLGEEKEEIINARREMWENVSFHGGFNNAAEANQALEAIQARTASYDAAHQRVERYRRALHSPYFARVDFTQQGWEDSAPEQIYIGLSTLIDEESYQTYVYDWRAPISSIFYRYETGPVSYQAPSGQIHGQVSLKRQYDISGGKLNYFFDSDVNILDEVLRTALSQNVSPAMRSIVETIQRQQDMIIRDTQNELVIVQGVAGSGKTSVALHRVAFLLYQGAASQLSANNVVIISPNNLFGSYIAGVLPELGEDNIRSLTFETLFHRVVPRPLPISDRSHLLERLISAPTPQQRHSLRQVSECKLSQAFTALLDRYVDYIARTTPLQDICYDGKVLFTRQQLRNLLLSSNRSIPLQKALEMLEKRIWTAIHRQRPRRLERLRAFVRPMIAHQYDYHSFGRLLSIKESGRLKRTIRAFTTLDIPGLYRKLFATPGLLQRLSQGLELSAQPHQLLSWAQSQDTPLPYEDAMPLLYLAIRLTGPTQFWDIKQVVVDEAQDYSPLHYHILSALFPNARYTVMGDQNQAIERSTAPTVYAQIQQILKRKSCCVIQLNQGFRCCAEINRFSAQFLEDPSQVESFDRHGQAPQVLCCQDEPDLLRTAASTVREYLDAGLQSVGILTKSLQEARQLAPALRQELERLGIPLTLLDISKRELFSGVMLLPVYMAKGLEFDGGVVLHVDQRYQTPYDRKLLYVASTRALHRLTLLYTQTLSPLVTELSQ